MYDFERMELFDLLNDIIGESLANELLLVEEGRQYFDGYCFGYLDCKPFRFVEDNFKPLGVYDDEAHTRHLENLSRIKVRREARYQQRIKENKIRLELQRKERAVREKRHAAYLKRKKKKLEEEARAAEEKRLEEEYQKRKKEREEVSAYMTLYDPLFPTQMSLPPKKKNQLSTFRKQYQKMYGEPGHEDAFLEDVMGCKGLGFVEYEALKKEIWPEGS